MRHFRLTGGAGEGGTLDRGKSRTCTVSYASRALIIFHEGHAQERHIQEKGFGFIDERGSGKKEERLEAR